MLDKIKSMVTRQGTQTAKKAAGGSLSTVSGGTSSGCSSSKKNQSGAESYSVSKFAAEQSRNTALPGILREAASLAAKAFEEKEWHCPCGHKFRAPGEWIATEPIYCEVPSCPNPKYYVDGPGKALLEANPGGVKLSQVDSTARLETGAGSSSSGSGSKSTSSNNDRKDGMGGRFGR